MACLNETKHLQETKMANTYTALHYHLVYSTKNRAWFIPQ